MRYDWKFSRADLWGDFPLLPIVKHFIPKKYTMHNTECLHREILLKECAKKGPQIMYEVESGEVTTNQTNCARTATSKFLNEWFWRQNIPKWVGMEEKCFARV